MVILNAWIILISTANKNDSYFSFVKNSIKYYSHRGTPQWPPVCSCRSFPGARSEHFPSSSAAWPSDWTWRCSACCSPFRTAWWSRTESTGKFCCKKKKNVGTTLYDYFKKQIYWGEKILPQKKLKDANNGTFRILKSRWAYQNNHLS